MKNHATVVTVFLILHHAIAIMHGGAHTELQVSLTTFQETFVNVILILLPVVAVILVWTRFAAIGLWLLLICMAGSLVFDVYFHYIFVSPDNVAHLPDGPAELHSQFTVTAGLLALLQGIGTALAAYFLWLRRAATQ